MSGAAVPTVSRISSRYRRFGRPVSASTIRLVLGHLEGEGSSKGGRQLRRRPGQQLADPRRVQSRSCRREAMKAPRARPLRDERHLPACAAARTNPTSRRAISSATRWLAEASSDASRPPLGRSRRVEDAHRQHRARGGHARPGRHERRLDDALRRAQPRDEDVVGVSGAPKLVDDRVDYRVRRDGARHSLEHPRDARLAFGAADGKSPAEHELRGQHAGQQPARRPNTARARRSDGARSHAARASTTTAATHTLTTRATVRGLNLSSTEVRIAARRRRVDSALVLIPVTIGSLRSRPPADAAREAVGSPALGLRLRSDRRLRAL